MVLLVYRDIGVCVRKLSFLTKKCIRMRHCYAKSIKDESLNNVNLRGNTVLTLGGSAFTSEIPGRIPLEPYKTWSTSNLGSLQNEWQKKCTTFI